jgi:exosortase H (IPTLxxWG-CTERM-specific)
MRLPREGRQRSDRNGNRKVVSTIVRSRPNIARFCFIFLLLVMVFTLLSSTASAQRFLHAPLCNLIAKLAAPVLAAFGSVGASGNYLSLNGFGVSIEEACDGVLPAYIFLAAVLALPSRWRDKARGIVMGIAVIFLINLVRVITLVICGAYWPAVFERVHIYVWQALVIGISMALWVFWAERFVRPNLEARR